MRGVFASFAAVSLLLIVLLPLGVEGWFDGVPWTNWKEVVVIVVLLPALFLLGWRFLTLPAVSTALFAILAGNLLLSLNSPSSGWLVKVYATQQESEREAFTRTYASLWQSGVSAVLDHAWLDKRAFPIESIVERDPDFLASGGGWRSESAVDALSLKLWVDVEGTVRLPPGTTLAVFAQGASEARFEGVDAEGRSVSVPLITEVDRAPALASDVGGPRRFTLSGRIAYEGRQWTLVPLLIHTDGRVEPAFGEGVLWQDAAALALSGAWLGALGAIARLVDAGFVIFLAVWLGWLLRRLSGNRILTPSIAILSLGAAALPWLMEPVVEGGVVPALLKLEGWIGPFPTDFTILLTALQLGSALGIVGIGVLVWAYRHPSSWALESDHLAHRVIIVFAPAVLGFFLAQWWSDIGRMAFDVDTRDDWHTYRVFARIIAVEGQMLFAGERVFDYQPFYRYVVALLHWLFGQSTIAHRLLDVWAVLGVCALVAMWAGRLSPRAGLIAAILYIVPTTASVLYWHIGRGLIEYTALAFMMLAFAALYHAGEHSRMSRVIVAGVLAVLGFWTRTDHLGVLAAMGVLLLEPVEGGTRTAWTAFFRGLVRHRSRLLVYFGILAAGVALLVARNLVVGGGTLSPTHIEGAFPLSVWRNFYVLLTTSKISFPPQPITLVLVPGTLLGLLALVWRPRLLERVPLALGLVIAGSLAPYFFFSIYLGYPGRFSIHLLPLSVLVLAIVLDRLSARRQDGRKSAAVATDTQT